MLSSAKNESDMRQHLTLSVAHIYLTTTAKCQHYRLALAIT